MIIPEGLEKFAIFIPEGEKMKEYRSCNLTEDGFHEHTLPEKILGRVKFRAKLGSADDEFINKTLSDINTSYTQKGIIRELRSFSKAVQLVNGIEKKEMLKKAFAAISDALVKAKDDEDTLNAVLVVLDLILATTSAVVDSYATIIELVSEVPSSKMETSFDIIMENIIKPTMEVL